MWVHVDGLPSHLLFVCTVCVSVPRPHRSSVITPPCSPYLQQKASLCTAARKRRCIHRLIPSSWNPQPDRFLGLKVVVLMFICSSAVLQICSSDICVWGRKWHSIPHVVSTYLLSAFFLPLKHLACSEIISEVEAATLRGNSTDFFFLHQSVFTCFRENCCLYKWPFWFHREICEVPTKDFNWSMTHVKKK